jgi:hypothetical protein
VRPFAAAACRKHWGAHLAGTDHLHRAVLRLPLVFGQSRVSSATAFFAQSSTTKAMPAVAAAMSAAIAALLSARGKPRLACGDERRHLRHRADRAAYQRQVY